MLFFFNALFVIYVCTSFPMYREYNGGQISVARFDSLSNPARNCRILSDSNQSSSAGCASVISGDRKHRACTLYPSSPEI